MAPKSLIHLIPPPVDDAQPPMKNKQKMIILEKVGQESKSFVMYPVVEMIETTWKNAFNIILPKSLKELKKKL